MTGQFERMQVLDLQVPLSEAAAQYSEDGEGNLRAFKHEFAKTVAVDFQYDRGLDSPHGGRSRLVVENRHFAEAFFFPDQSDMTLLGIDPKEDFDLSLNEHVEMVGRLTSLKDNFAVLVPVFQRDIRQCGKFFAIQARE